MLGYMLNKYRKGMRGVMNCTPNVRQYDILLTLGVIFMPKGKPNRQYNGEFKQIVVEDMRQNKLSQKATANKYDITRSMVQRWERIYLEEGSEGLFIERRGRANATSGAAKGRKCILEKEVEEDLIAENQRLRAENAYLKNLQALVLKEERHQCKKHR
jgi:transposase-like protein